MRTKFNGILTLLLALTVQFTFAQKTVSGTVSDENGPLPGVNILVKGTKTGTETDFDGKYSLKAKQGDVLVFSFVGMQPVEKTVGTGSVIDVKMASGNTMEEIVITAMGGRKQAKSLGYASTKVSSSELTEVATSNPIENLSGKIAGVDISSPSQPGASTKIIFRGMSSITGSNNPLYVIDGSPVQDVSNSSIGSTSSFDAGTSLNDIDPNNIESINFLKGAAATALYGSRGSNGVIIVTTKKGKEKINASFSSSFEMSEVARVPHYQTDFGTGWDGKSYSNVAVEGSMAQSNENGSWGAAFNGLIRPWSRIIDNQQLIKPYVALENNMRDFFVPGYSYNNSLSLSNGGQFHDISFTYSRVDNDGVMPTNRDQFKKNNLGINAGVNLNKLSIRLTANYADKKQTAVPTGQGDDAGFGKSLMQEMIQMPNDVSIVDMADTSNIFYTASNFYTPYAANPYLTLENNNVIIGKHRFFGNSNFNYKFNDKFSAVFQIGADIDNEDIKRYGAIVEYLPDSPQDNAGANGVVGAVQEAKYTSNEFDAYLNFNYSTKFLSDFNLNALAGVNYNDRNGESIEVTVTDLDLPNYYELSNSASTPTLIQNNYQRRVLGVYGQTELSYLDRYFLTLSARNDFSSTLPIENNSYFYPSASLAAILFDTNNYYFKLRGGWARIGNDTDMYKVYSTAGQSSNQAYFGSIDYPLGGVNGLEVFGRIENQDLKPEITDEIEVGFESKFLNGKIGLDISLYNRATEGLIVDLPTAGSTGYTTISGNFVDLTNKGIELMFSAKPLVIGDFSWDLNYTFTKNKNNVTNVYGNEDKILIYSAYDTNFYAQEGKPLGVFYSPSPATTPNGQIIVDPVTGYYTYDGNETYNGSSERDFIMGLKNTFKFKSLKLNVSTDWKQGGVMYSYTKRLSYFVGNGIETTYNDRNPFIIPNSVVPDGLGGYVENTTPVSYEDVTGFYNDSQNAAIEKQHVIDKTFIRLRELSLSYDLPAKLLPKMSLSGISFTLYGKNLFLWTPSGNPYIDPETTTYGRGIRSEFGEFATNPSQRSYGASIKLTF